MSITPGGNTPILGDNGRPVNNPLVVLNGHLEAITAQLARIGGPTPPHRYAVDVAQDPSGSHGKMWGAYCLACSEAAETYVYPCQMAPEEQIKPPQFFTVGDTFVIDEHGRMLRYEPPSA